MSLPTRRCFPVTHRGPGWSRVSVAALWEKEPNGVWGVSPTLPGKLRQDCPL